MPTNSKNTITNKSNEMKKIFLYFLFLLCMLSFMELKAQKMVAQDFINSFPDLKVGIVIGEKECKAALKARVHKEAIAKIDYKTLLYGNANDISKWDIMPIGKFKISEGIYFVVYFSALMGANHTDTDCNYMLNTAVLDFVNNKKLGENVGNNAEYIVLSESRKKSLNEMLGKDNNMTLKANFTFTVNAADYGTMKSSWIFNKQEPKNQTYTFYWDTKSLTIR